MNRRAVKPNILSVALGVLCLTGCSEAGDPDGAAASRTVPPGAAEQAQSVAEAKAKTGALKKSGAAANAYGDGVLAYPDELQITMLAYRLTGRQPPLEEWAGEVREVRYADEFNKAGAMDAEVARLTAIYEATESIGYLQLRLSSQISQYDGAKGGYYLTAFAPGRQTAFNGREKVSLQLDNMSDAFFWAMDAGEAQEVLAHTSRNVTIDAKIRITGTERRSSGLVFKGRLDEYGIYSDRYNDQRLLASFTLE